MPSTYLVFVPGIMGSELFYPGPGRRCVWAENSWTILHTLLFEPWILDGHLHLEVGDVLSGPLTYGSLFGFLNQNGFNPTNFLKFSYDWRQPTSTSAERLVSKLREIWLASKGEITFTLLGHSIGCLIIRAAILAQNLPSGVIEKVIELAPPHRGSSKAFRQLKQFPDIHPIVTRTFQILRLLLPRFAQRIDSAWSLLARSLLSIWDLLPPDEEEILEQGGTGFLKSALQWEGWSKAADISGEVTRRRYALYSEIFSKGLGGLKVALAVGKGVYTEYRFDYSATPPYDVDFLNYLNYPLDGDGTVIVDSAEWLRPLDPDPNAPYLSVFINHNCIASHPTVQRWVLNEIP